MVYDGEGETRLRNRFAIGFSVLGAALLAAQLAQAGVPQKTLFRGAAGPVGIAVDAQGRLHVSWESSDHHLHYTRIEPGSKQDEVVDATSDCGSWSSIALDSAGRPHIAYNAFRMVSGAGHYELVYAHFDGTAWHIEDLAEGGAPTAIAIDANDRPHIAHMTTEYPPLLKYLHLEDTGWQTETPPGPWGFMHRPISLALDSGGHAHIGMVSEVVSHPLYVTNASGDWVKVELADVDAWGISLALDSLGHPHVALPLVSGVVRYRHFDGSDWLSEDLYDPNDLPPGTSAQPQDAELTLDGHDRPAILFKVQVHAYGDAADFVIYTYHDGAEWLGIALARRAASDWVRLATDPGGGSEGVYALRGRGDTQIARRFQVKLPDPTGDWSTLSVSDEAGRSRVDAVLEVRNEGAAKSRSAQISFYLSSDAVLDPGDTPLALRKASGALAPGGTREVMISFKRLGSLAGLYLIAVLDPLGRLDELDRPSNRIAGFLGN